MSSILTDSLDTTNRILRAVLLPSTVQGSEQTGMGWRLEFAVSEFISELLNTRTIILEEGCDERVRRHGKIGWTSAEVEVSRSLRSIAGSSVRAVFADKHGGLEVAFNESFDLKLAPASFSPDWQWTLIPSNERQVEIFSVVSVKDESIWTRYPVTLDELL